MNFYFDCINRTTMSFIMKYFIPAIMLLCSCDQIVTKSVDVTTTTTTIAYIVEFTAGDGSGAVVQYSVTGDEEVTVPPCEFVPPPGKKFGYWQMTAGTDGQNITFAIGDVISHLAAMNSATVVIRAVWIDKAALTLTYRNYYPSAGGSLTKEFRESDTVILADATADSFVFGGWYDGTSDDARRIYGWHGLDVTTDITVWGRWTVGVCTVRFNANGGSGTMADMSFAGNEEKPLTACTFNAPTGMMFAGWNTKRDGSGTSYANGQTVSNLTSEQNIVLFAQWTDKAAHRITYHNLKNADNTANPVSFHEKDNITLRKPAGMQGYTFLGWYDDENGTNEVKGWFAGEKTADMSLWARWQPVSYKVQFDGNGGSGVMADMALATDESKPLTVNTFSAPSGMKFGSWNTKRDGSGTTYANAQTVCNLTTDSSIVLFAQWIDRDAHRIIYHNLKNADNSLNPTSFMEKDNVLIRFPADAVGYSCVSLWAMTDSHYNDICSELSARTAEELKSSLTELGVALTGDEIKAELVELITDSDPRLADITYNSWSAGEVTGDVHFFPMWTAYTYTAVFDANGAAGTMTSQNMTYDTVAALTANTFTKVGYTFGGWATTPSGAKVYDDNQSVKNLTADNGVIVILYAVWTPITYTVSFDANGGTGTMSNQTMTYDTSAALTQNTFTRTGYTFLGWSANSSATTASYADKSSVVNLSAGSTVTLYAIWKVNTYTVAFNANGGSGTMANQSMIYDVAANLTGNAFTKTGYTFGGWATSASGAKTYNDKQSVSKLSATNGGTYTLYAKWTANSYSVAFNANGGTGTMSNLAMTYGTAKALTANAFTRTGYTFAGWATTNNATSATYTNKQSVNNLTSVSSGTVTLYAVWTPKTLTITYKDVGGAAYSGSNSSSLPTTHTYGTDTAIPLGTKTNSTFLGWYTTSNASSDPISVLGETAYTANITLYAQWSSSVTFNLDGGSSGQSVMYVNLGEKKVVTPATKTNYVFQGYYTQTKGKGTKYFDADGNPTTAWNLSSNTTLYAGYKYKTLTNFNATMSGATINCTWTNPQMTYNITIYDGNKQITTNTSGGSTSWNYTFTNAYIKNNIKVVGLYYDNNSVDGKGVETTKTFSVSEPFFFVNSEKMEKSGLKQVLSSSETITCDQSNGVFLTVRDSVKLEKYAIGKYPVTKQLYNAVMGYDLSIYSTLEDIETNSMLKPVVCVNWYEAIIFCNKLSLLMGRTPCYSVSGVNDWESLFFYDVPTSNNSNWDNAVCDWTANGYRLPTDCEWECAARGGIYSTTTPWTYTYSGSNTIGDVAWYISNGNSHTWEVGLKQANSLGLYDMNGNVYEWLWDLFSMITASTPVTGGLSTSQYYLRSTKGGSYNRDSLYCTVYATLNDIPYNRFTDIGFRLACKEE